MVFRLRITTGSRAPIYRQITDQVRMAVGRGSLAPGERMPSVRDQAERLLVNPNTVARAYRELVADGVLRSEPGRGLFVSERSPRLGRAEQHRRLEPELEALARSAAGLGLGEDELLRLVSQRMRRLARTQGKPTTTEGAGDSRTSPSARRTRKGAQTHE